ncbi:MAG: hypothetical protein WDN72_07345 [Alphaproteobacteria bacterium]
MQATLNPLTMSNALSPSSNYSASDIVQTDSTFESLFADQNETPQEILKDLTSNGVNGYMKWKIDQMKDKATAQVMNSMGLTKAQVEGMPTDQRIALEKKIESQVEQEVKMSIQQEMKKNANSGPRRLRPDDLRRHAGRPGSLVLVVRA